MSKNEKNTFVTSDERTKQNTSNAALITLCIIWLGVLLYAVYKAFKYGADTITEELVILFGSCVLFLFLQGRHKDIDLPKSLSGRVLPAGRSKKDVKKRISSYLLEGALDAAVLSGLNVCLMKLSPAYTFTKVVDLSSVSATLIANFAIDFAVTFAVIFALSFFVGERSVKKYNAQTREEDEFDNTLK